MTPARVGISGLMLLTALPGCASTQPESPLTGTQWRLVSITSMDDAQGVTEISESASYTVRFDEGGRAAFTIDCDTASSSWDLTPSDDPMSGQLTFGALTATEKACPQPSLDERVTTSIASVRGYLQEEGLLHMSLLADAGTLDWAPV